MKILLTLLTISKSCLSLEVPQVVLGSAGSAVSGGALRLPSSRRPAKTSFLLKKIGQASWIAARGPVQPAWCCAARGRAMLVLPSAFVAFWALEPWCPPSSSLGWKSSPPRLVGLVSRSMDPERNTVESEADLQRLLTEDREGVPGVAAWSWPLPLRVGGLLLGLVALGLSARSMGGSLQEIDVWKLEEKMHDSYKNDPDCKGDNVHHLDIKTYCGPGEGIQTYATGPKGNKEWPFETVQSSVFKQGMPVGQGVAWSTDQKKAWLMKDGEASKKLKDYAEAKAEAKKLGLPM
eukprot:g18764.t1